MELELALPARSAKPRRTGLTMAIDNGLPVGVLADALRSALPHVDLVKLGWGTAAVTPLLEDKLALLDELGLDWFFGGTLFELHVLQDRFDAFRRLCRDAGCRYVEVSNGTVAIDEAQKAAYVARLAEDFEVLSEVGSKTADGDARLTPKDWTRQIRTDLAHGARLVITESRESGTTGLADASGAVRDDLLDTVVRAGVDPELLLFEAPTKTLQAHLVKRFGPDVNLGNISPLDLVSVETLRLGLRSDTLLALHERCDADLYPDACSDAVGLGSRRRA